MPRTKKSMSDNAKPENEFESYSALRRQLDDVMAKLQNPDCDVDEAAALYAEVLRSIKRLEEHLQQAENRVRKAQADFAAEELV